MINKSVKEGPIKVYREFNQIILTDKKDQTLWKAFRMPCSKEKDTQKHRQAEEQVLVKMERSSIY